jgi:hypothetical protein
MLEGRESLDTQLKDLRSKASYDFRSQRFFASTTRDSARNQASWKLSPALARRVAFCAAVLLGGAWLHAFMRANQALSAE